MTIQMTSLTRAECAGIRNCQKSLFGCRPILLFTARRECGIQGKI